MEARQIKPIRIRAATERDLAAVYRIFLDSVDGLTGACYNEAQRRAWQASVTLSSFRFAITEGPFLVALSGREVVGFGSVATRRLELSYLYVATQWTGQGVGKLLLDALETQAQASGLSSLQLVASLNAKTFYVREGYRVRAEIVRERRGVQLPCLEMDKPLK